MNCKSKKNLLYVPSSSDPFPEGTELDTLPAFSPPDVSFRTVLWLECYRVCFSALVDAS